MQEQAKAFGATVILIEDKASGTQLIQELIEAGIRAVTRFKPEGDKLMRLHAQTGSIENGFVYLPTEAHWLAEYLHELTTFPNGKFDDQVDSTSQFLSWANHRKPGWGIMEYYRREVERMRGGDNDAPGDAPVRLKVPPGISHIYPANGPRIVVPPDGIIELPERDAKPLLAAGYVKVRPQA